MSLTRHLENVRKIGVLRANALGDFIVTLPALKAIRSAYPDAEIVLLGKPWHKQFLVPGRTPVDRVIIVPIKKGIRTESHKGEDENEVNDFLIQMQKEQFDIVINLQGNGISANPFIKKFKAKTTVGLTCEKSEKLDFSLDYYYSQSEVIRFLEVAKLIGAKTIDLEPEIKVFREDKEEIEEFVLALNKPFIVLHPVAVDVRRMWPIENYAELADELKKRNFEIVFTGAVEDRDAVERVINNMNFSAINACGNFSLGGLAALLSKASVMISADTGPLHLGRAVNVPTIGFYWAPNLINWGPLTRAIHRPLISWNMACPLCGIVPNDPYPFEPHSETCDHKISFVRDITVEQVLEALDSLTINEYHKSTNKVE
ncbi:glycosyltransferase family 9 protein [Segetibacter koreensis]|uniref:glycosyltransferase family 9 protein n=1 Tax=Segetibacter koreensis TaxID=398037 RepID=UPI00035FA6BA|nr:glycosyltransferase family 9 protein [Segetibacter koreensis]